MREIIFITYASNNSGRGHLIRVLRAVELIKNEIDCKVLLNSNIENKSYFQEKYVIPYSSFCEANKKILDLELNNVDLLWFDLPDSKYEKMKAFKHIDKYKVSINMFEKKEDDRFEDLGIHPVFEESTRDIVGKKKLTTQLSGADFISIPSCFFKKDELKNNVVIVTMGGTDPMKFMPLVIKSLCLIQSSQFLFKVILPISILKSTLNYEFKNKKFIKFFDFNELNFAEELKNAKFSIINGGMSRYECIASRTFFIALSIHQEQYNLSEKVCKFGHGFNFGIFKESDIVPLSKFLIQLKPDIKKIITSNPYSGPMLHENNITRVLGLIKSELKNENE